MQAISIRQPCAWAIARGHKTLTNRDTATTYRGPLLVHASLHIDLKSCDSPLMHAARWDPQDPLAALGAIIAVAELVDVCVQSAKDGDRCACGPWAVPGMYHWHFTNVRALPRPIGALGQAGVVWSPAPALIRDVQAALGAAPVARLGTATLGTG